MAGVFYTLQDVIQKLGKDEAGIKALVKEGKLREFRDGAKQLYKIEDVDAIASAAKGGDAVLNDSLQISIDETGEVSLAPEELDVLMGDDKNTETKFKLDETGELLADEKQEGGSKPADKSKSGSEILLSPGETSGGKVDASSSTSGILISEGSSQQGSAISSDDTKITPVGDTISVLSDSDTGYKISEDTSGDTKLVPKKPKALDQKGGEGAARLDEDVNLDGTAASGSGLLDLALQADDTSLGAVLDDIYPDSQTTPVEQAPVQESPAMSEAEKMLEQPEAGVEMPDEVVQQEAPAPVGAVMSFESPADATSNIFGVLLFVPLAVLIYSAIVVVSGYKPILNMPIVSAIGPIIWYVAGGLGAIIILGVLIATFTGAPKKPKAPKAPKVKKVKPPKEKKVKAKKGEQPPAAA